MVAVEEWAMYEWDPATFAQDKLGLEPDEAQTAFLNCTEPEQLLLWARQTGKTTLSAVKVVHRALFVQRSMILITSATQRQAGIVQARVLGFLRMLGETPSWVATSRTALMPESVGGRLIRCSTLSLELANGSVVVSVPASPDTVRGYSPTLILMDEAARIPDAVYAAVRPMRAATHAQLIACSTAAGMRGWFYNAWLKPEGWWTSRVDAVDCERVSAEFLSRERNMVPDLMYQQEYENKFLAMSGAPLDKDTIDSMFDSTIEALDVGVSTMVSDEVEALEV